MKKLFTLAAAILASFSLWAADITWDFTGYAEKVSLTNNSSYSFNATDGSTEMRYTAGSSDEITAINGTKPSYLKENGKTGSASAKDVDGKTAINKNRLIRLFVEGKGKLTINCNGTNGVYKVYNGSASGTVLINSYSANAQSSEINVTTSPIWIETTTKGYINSIVWSPSATTPSLKSITIAGVEATIDESAATITAELPYGTVINDAIDAATVTLGGTAKSYEIADDHTTLTVYNEDKSASKVYTFALTVAESASTDATLKTLAVNGVAVTLEEDVFTYDVELPYATTVVATCEVNDPAAEAADPDYSTDGKVIIVVTAQAGNTKTYTVNYTILPANKDLLEAAFSNGAKGAIADGNIRVPYLYGEDAPTFVSAKFWNADGEPTAEIVEGKLVITGIDGGQDEYTIEYVAVTPASVAYDTEITFDGTETYVFAPYGFGAYVKDSDYKGWKIAKNLEEAGNHRVSSGNARMYFALPKAASVDFVSGTTGARDVKIYVNGVESDKNKTAAKDEAITLDLSSNSANFIAIESNQTGGDTGFTKMTIAKPIATAIDNTDATVKAVKVLRDGQLLIEKNGKTYNAFGQTIR